MIMSTPKPDGVREDWQDRFQKNLKLWSMIRRNIFELVYTQWLKDEAAGPFLDEDAVYEEGFEYVNYKAYGLRNQHSSKPEGLVRLVEDYGYIREVFFKQGQ